MEYSTNMHELGLTVDPRPDRVYARLREQRSAPGHSRLLNIALLASQMVTKTPTVWVDTAR